MGQLPASVGKPDASPATGETQPVITIPGLCSERTQGKEQGKAACRTVITREEFEKLMNALNPGGQEISPSGRQNLALAYVEALAFASAARQSGMEETEQVRQVLYWARLRTLADLYRRSLQERYRSPSDEDIHAYYQEHVPSFENVRLLRILVPRDNFSGADKDAFDRKALTAAQAAHQRARSGEDFERIQKDAYATLGLERPPSTELGTFRRPDLIEKEAAEVFSLPAGGVSQLEIEVKSYVIYKVVSRETLTESQARAEIVREISQQKYREGIKAVTESAPAEFNEQYFGPMKKPPVETPAMPTHRPAR